MPAASPTLSRTLLLVVAAALVVSCSGGSDGPTGPDAEVGPDVPSNVVTPDGADAAPGPDVGEPDSVTDADAEPETAPGPPAPFPVGLPATDLLGEPHGYQLARAIIHVHSIYSHDACDGEPVLVDGQPNEECLDSMRHALCADHVDFAMMTEHYDRMTSEQEFDALFLQREGDTWVDEDGVHAANAVHCDDDHAALIMPGLEGSAHTASPLGLTGHPVDGTPEEILAAYKDATDEGIQKLRDRHGVPTAIHLEGWDAEHLHSVDLDALEIGNLHVLMAPDYLRQLGLDPARPAAAFIDYVMEPEAYPTPDLVFLEFHVRLPMYLEWWDDVLGERMVAGFVGNDAHQNVYPKEMIDGDRPDSYRRMFKWYGNHLLVADKSPSQAREAIAEGRLYMVFEILGSPVGFDFWAARAGGDYVMGETVDSGGDPASVHLRCKLPQALLLGDAHAVPSTVRLYRVTAGGTELVAESDEDLDVVAPGPGRYRVEVEMTPTHLAPYLEGHERLLHPYPWIYSNAIEVL